MKTYEDTFIDALHQYDPRDPAAAELTELLAFLHPASRHRWRAYADSYVFRVTNALTETLLERAAMLYGDGFIKQMVFDYIHKNPPQAALMPDCLEGFAAFLRTHPPALAHPELVDIVDLAQKRWQVLIGPDPSPVPDEIFADPNAWSGLFLQKNSRFLPSRLPLHSLWTQAKTDKGNETDEGFIPDQSEAVLLCKSSPFVLHTLKIAEPFVPLLTRLASGQSLAAALDVFDWDTEANEANFVELMRQLRENSAFET